MEMEARLGIKLNAQAQKADKLSSLAKFFRMTWSPRLAAKAKSMVTPVFATLIVEGVVASPKSIRRRCRDHSPRHDESRA
ncbi:MULTISPECIES: hypothetical protein [Paraburkholderia]|uniref:Uncharacterized protein n=1 Tax=Paraburkholderia podalyriae TaxID=1938811 RepID=A0ABR7Q1K6_9BURK|nr:hypothetical protein [Paraburkholderia podalyriae]MBC8752425.1 hypothetical protein [Paraburkholderia podalyriae]